MPHAVTITFADGERRRVARNDHPVRPMPLIPFREYRPDVTDYAQRAPPPGGHVERSRVSPCSEVPEASVAILVSVRSADGNSGSLPDRNQRRGAHLVGAPRQGLSWLGECSACSTGTLVSLPDSSLQPQLAQTRSVIGDARQQRLARAGRTDQQDVRLRELDVAVLGLVVETLVVIVHRDREHSWRDPGRSHSRRELCVSPLESGCRRATSPTRIYSPLR